MQKIIEAHLVSGTLDPGSEVGIIVDHTLIQDAPGAMALLQFEAMSVTPVRTKRLVAYIDHNMLQNGFESMDDMWSSRPPAVRSDCVFPGRGMDSAIRSIWSTFQCRGIPFWARTAIAPPEMG